MTSEAAGMSINVWRIMWPGGGVLPPLLLPLPEVQLTGCPEAPEDGAEVEDRVQWQIPPSPCHHFFQPHGNHFPFPVGLHL